MSYTELKIDETTREWIENHPVKIEWFAHETAQSILLGQPEDADVLEAYARSKNLSGWFSKYGNDDWNGPADSAEDAAYELYEAYA